MVSGGSVLARSREVRPVGQAARRDLRYGGGRERARRESRICYVPAQWKRVSPGAGGGWKPAMVRDARPDQREIHLRGVAISIRGPAQGRSEKQRPRRNRL